MLFTQIPVAGFQNLMWRSAVPPPLASRFLWNGHQSNACKIRAKVSFVIRCPFTLHHFAWKLNLHFRIACNLYDLVTLLMLYIHVLYMFCLSRKICRGITIIVLAYVTYPKEWTHSCPTDKITCLGGVDMFFLHHDSVELGGRGQYDPVTACSDGIPYPTQEILESINSFLLTLTAAWCWLKENNGWLLFVLLLMLASHRHNKLSFPPLAKYFPSGDHFRPHTSWLCLVSVPTWWLATRTSWWWIDPLRQPLNNNNNTICNYYYNHETFCPTECPMQTMKRCS